EALLGTVALIALLLVRRRAPPGEPLGALGSAAFALSLLLLRGLKAVPQVTGALGIAANPMNDEIRASVGLGLPAWAVPVLSAAIGLGLFSFLAVRSLPRGRRALLTATALVAASGGALTWLAVGERLL